MSKVLTERPRVYGKYIKLGRELSEKPNPGDYDSLDETSLRQGMRPRHNDRKVFSDLISPLYRFLLGCVGRHWNDVYSEIRENIRPDSTMQNHVLQHVDGFVRKEVKMIKGLPYEALDSLGYKTKQWELNPITSSGRSRYKSLYVNPDTGILCIAPKRPEIKKDQEILLIQVDKHTQLRKHEGIWYGLKLSALQNPTVTLWGSTRYEGFDSFLKKSLIFMDEHELNRLYGKGLYCSKVWQLGKKELDRWVRPTLNQ